MSNDIMQVIRVDFDNMENKIGQAKTQTTLGTFTGDDKLTAHGKAAEFINTLPSCGFFLGWDGGVYPQIKTVNPSQRR